MNRGNLGEQVILDILAHEMRLNSQSLWVRDQARQIPETPCLFIVAGLLDSQCIANVMEIEPVDYRSIATLKQINTVITRDNIQIDIFSSTTEAITRRWEVLASLMSVYSQQQQEENNFRIFQIPNNFVNTSSAEGGSMLNRFSITVACHVWYRKETILAQKDIFDDFGTRVDDANTIGEENGLIEFSIN